MTRAPGGPRGGRSGRRATGAGTASATARSARAGVRRAPPVASAPVPSEAAALGETAGRGERGQRVSIEVANESGIMVDEPGLAALARYVLDAMGMHPLAELSVLLVDTGTMADLHQRWLGEPGPTDVLAFPMDELRPPPPGSDRADRA